MTNEELTAMRNRIEDVSTTDLEAALSKRRVQIENEIIASGIDDPLLVRVIADDRAAKEKERFSADYIRSNIAKAIRPADSSEPVKLKGLGFGDDAPSELQTKSQAVLQSPIVRQAYEQAHRRHS